MVIHKFYVGEILRSGCDTIIVLTRGKDIGLIKNIDERFGNLFRKVVETGDFKGDVGEAILLYPASNVDMERYVVASIGNEDLEGVRTAVANAILKVKDLSERTLMFIPKDLVPNVADAIEQSVISVELSLYDAGSKYKVKDKKEIKIKEVYYSSNDGVDHGPKIDGGLKIARAVNYARDIANAPPSIMNPEGIEEEARKLAKEYRLNIKVYYYEDLKKLGLNGIIAVGSGGGVKPRLIILEYRGREEDKWDLALIGKTVTFDAGGLDLKRPESMIDMKFDKSGGAAALGIIKGLAELRLPVNVIVALPAVENLPGPKAYKPRDVIQMYNGLTVEIGNTDAEGRIVLADTLSFIEKNYAPKRIIDLATLTGAIVIALGNHAIGLFSNDDEFANELMDIGNFIGERLWRMPLWKEYYEQLKSDVADTNNIGGRPAGAITAAAFLSKFIENTKWVHLDIAGTAWVQQYGPKKPYYPKGATGIGVRLILYYLLVKIVKDSK